MPLNKSPKNISKRIFGKLKAGENNSRSKFHEELTIWVLKRNYSLIVDLLDSNIHFNLDKIFVNLMTSKKLIKPIEILRDYFSYKLLIDFFYSDVGKAVIKDYESKRNKKLSLFTQLLIEDKIKSWVKDQFVFLQAISILFISDPKIIYKELQKFEVPKLPPQKGRPSKWVLYFLISYQKQKDLEKKYERIIRGKSDLITGLKFILNEYKIPYRRSIYTSFINWIKKYESKL